MIDDHPLFHDESCLCDHCKETRAAQERYKPRLIALLKTIKPTVNDARKYWN